MEAIFTDTAGGSAVVSWNVSVSRSAKNEPSLSLLKPPVTETVVVEAGAKQVFGAQAAAPGEKLWAVRWFVNGILRKIIFSAGGNVNDEFVNSFPAAGEYDISVAAEDFHGNIAEAAWRARVMEPAVELYLGETAIDWFDDRKDEEFFKVYAPAGRQLRIILQGEDGARFMMQVLLRSDTGTTGTWEIPTAEKGIQLMVDDTVAGWYHIHVWAEGGYGEYQIRTTIVEASLELLFAEPVREDLRVRAYPTCDESLDDQFFDSGILPVTIQEDHSGEGHRVTFNLVTQVEKYPCSMLSPSLMPWRIHVVGAGGNRLRGARIRFLSDTGEEWTPIASELPEGRLIFEEVFYVPFNNPSIAVDEVVWGFINFLVGNELDTITSRDANLMHKSLAVGLIGFNFIPGGVGVKGAVMVGKGAAAAKRADDVARLIPEGQFDDALIRARGRFPELANTAAAMKAAAKVRKGLMAKYGLSKEAVEAIEFHFKRSKDPGNFSLPKFKEKLDNLGGAVDKAKDGSGPNLIDETSYGRLLKKIDQVRKNSPGVISSVYQAEHLINKGYRVGAEVKVGRAGKEMDIVIYNSPTREWGHAKVAQEIKQVNKEMLGSPNYMEKTLQSTIRQSLDQLDAVRELPNGNEIRRQLIIDARFTDDLRFGAPEKARLREVASDFLGEGTGEQFTGYWGSIGKRIDDIIIQTPKGPLVFKRPDLQLPRSPVYWPE